MTPTSVASLLRQYDRPGPRYTSYPTAVEFNDSFDHAAYVGRLEAAAAVGQPLSLYTPPAVLPGAVLLLRLHGDHHPEARGRGPLPRLSRARDRDAGGAARPAAADRAAPLGGRHPDLSRAGADAAAPRRRWRALRVRRRRREVASRSTPGSPRPSSSTCCARSASTGSRWACRTSPRRCRRPSTAASRSELTRDLYDYARAASASTRSTST